MGDDPWIKYYSKLLQQVKETSGISTSHSSGTISANSSDSTNETQKNTNNNAVVDNYVILLGILQACSDFTKPATVDEEKLLKSILAMNIELEPTEEKIIDRLRQEFQKRCRADSSGSSSKANGHEGESPSTLDKKLQAQARHINVLMEQNRILLEAAKYHQQKSTLVMAMHNKTNVANESKKSGGSSNTPTLAPGANPSPGAFRQLRISTPPVRAMSGLPRASASTSTSHDANNPPPRENSDNSQSSTVLSQLITQNAGLSSQAKKERKGGDEKSDVDVTTVKSENDSQKLEAPA